MKKSLAQKIISDIKKHLYELAQKEDFIWFYNLHQKEVVKSVGQLLESHPEADKETVLISAWLHDIVHYYAGNKREHAEVKKTHHTEGAKIAEKFLKKYDLTSLEIGRIKKCIERHRNCAGFKPETIEEKIVAVGDTMSHYQSIFYLIHFKFHPQNSLEDLVRILSAKFERDWEDLKLLPEARKIVKERYRVLKEMVSDFNKD